LGLGSGLESRFEFGLGFGIGFGLEYWIRPRPKIGPVFEREIGSETDEFSAGLSDCVLDSAGPLGSFTSAGASLVGIRSRGASKDKHVPFRLRIRVLPVYSLIPGSVARNAVTRTMNLTELTQDKPEGDGV
jgi:hypothetical protein